MKRCLLVLWMVLIGAVSPALGAKTVQDRVHEYGEITEQRWAPYFQRADVPYPPRSVTLIGMKQERRLEVYAAGTNADFRFIRSYPVLAASGKPGPKLREGDLQVPEGLYRVEALNPNSAFHLSLRLNYPNEDDRARAKVEKYAATGGAFV